MSDRQVSICIPTFNRVELLFNSFERVKDNDNVSEIVIVDDVSREDIYERIVERAKENPKIKLFRNKENLDCYKNKYEAIAHATGRWCCLWDSDNEFSFDYLYHLFQMLEWCDDTAYLPSFAAPHFDYRKYEGLTITSDNVAKYMDDPTFSCMLNTHNHFVNKRFYMKCWDESTNPHTSDSIYMNYLWLKNGGKLYVVPGLTYQHRVDNHEGEEAGHYNTNQHKTGDFHQWVERKLRELK